MTARDGQNDNLQDFATFTQHLNSSESQDWIDAADASNPVEPEDRSFVIGVIPSLDDEPAHQYRKPKKYTGYLFKVGILSTVFGMGFLSARAFPPQQKPQPAPIAQNQTTTETNDLAKSLSNINVDDSVFDTPLKADEFPTVETTCDNLYGSPYQTSTDSNYAFDSFDNSVQTPYGDSISRSPSQGVDEKFPTWADLSPQVPNQVNESASSGLNEEEYARYFAPQNAPVSSGVSSPSSSVVTSPEPQLARYENIEPSESYADSYRDKRAANNVSDFSNYTCYNKKTSIPTERGTKNLVPETRYVGNFENVTYNKYERNNETSNGNEDMSSFDQTLAPSNEETEEVLPRRSSEFQGYASSPARVDKSQIVMPSRSEETVATDESSRPNYVSSIPTFSNPHPETNVPRKEYVAQNYENTGMNAQSGAQTPKRSIRW